MQPRSPLLVPPFSSSSGANVSPSQRQNNLSWYSGMSPYRYELIEFPTGASVCYGCSQEFADKYKSPPQNLIVRHKDKRIRAKGEFGQKFFNDYYSFTYYHPNRIYTQKKNPCFDDEVPITYDLYNLLGHEKILYLSAASGLKFQCYSPNELIQNNSVQKLGIAFAYAKEDMIFPPLQLCKLSGLAISEFY